MTIEITEIISKQLESRNINNSEIDKQVERFKNGYPYSNLVRPCTTGDGIKQLNKDEFNSYINIYNNSLNKLSVSKFVPASGAASRMFRDLVNLQNNLDKNNLDSNNRHVLDRFLDNLDNFAFRTDLDDKLNGKLAVTLDSKNFSKVLDYLLNDTGLNYKDLPKGLIKFHQYRDVSRTAFEEHLVEGIKYLNPDIKYLHFTIQNDFLDQIKENIDQFKTNDICREYDFEVSYSSQDPSTDTIAVDLDNKPVLNENSELVFRPAGHGALIGNLNSINRDIIFIKNIDNVVKENMLGETVDYKKALGGYLIWLREEVYKYLEVLTSRSKSSINYEEITGFCKSSLFLDIEGSSEEELHKLLVTILNRPIRICGVVMNEGEPGGGPFWVEDSNKKRSMQIVESAQVDMNSSSQKDIWSRSTHFNPVDIVCSVYDFNGNKFNLMDFIDLEAGIITKKSYEGKEIKALELPGLWNGSMANWNTVFVEVPLSTFNPVKTVFDLLREKHQ